LLRILVLTKRQYMNKDLIDDRFGRFREIPLALARMGHSVHGLCLSYASRNEGWIKDGPVLWKSINAGALKAAGLIRFIKTAGRYAEEADVIWACSDSFYGVIGCALGRIYNVPVVFDIYDNFGAFFVARLPLAKQLYHWALRHSDAITCLSKPFAEFILDRYAPHQRIYPVEFAVRTDLFKPLDKLRCREMFDLPSNARIIGTAGALYKIREVGLLLEAFEKLKKQNPDLHLALAGPRDIHIPADTRIHDCGILPFEKVPNFINALDVAVVCYADDDFGKYCFPQKTREFMACNIPVIAAKVGSLKDIFKDHPQWLYEPGNPLSLTETLARRLVEQKTDYDTSPVWKDLALKVEKIMLNLNEEPL
jgi:glycosyltransferase involved in cell wall biosynthesis